MYAMEIKPRRCAVTFAARVASLLATLSLTAVTQNASALPQDSKQPVEVSADRTEFDNNKQQHTLSGNVQVKQGSMVISASSIKLQLVDGEISEITGRGKPLRYSITDGDGKPMTATAQHIIYRPIDAKLSLLGGASLSRPDREMSGERIDYNIANARINAQGTAKKRVRIVIQPETKK